MRQRPSFAGFLAVLPHRQERGRRFRLCQVDTESPECNLFYMQKLIEPTDVERVRDYNGKETPYPKGYEFSLSDAEREELGLRP